MSNLVSLPNSQHRCNHQQTECAYELSTEERSLTRNTRFSILTQHKQHSRRFDSSCFRKVVLRLHLHNEAPGIFHCPAWGGGAIPETIALHNSSLTIKIVIKSCLQYNTNVIMQLHWCLYKHKYNYRFHQSLTHSLTHSPDLSLFHFANFIQYIPRF